MTSIPMFTSALPLPVRLAAEQGRQDADSPSQQSAWQREMERAQMRNWLKHPASAASPHRQTDISHVNESSPEEHLKPKQLVSLANASAQKTVASTPIAELAGVLLAPRTPFAIPGKSGEVSAGEPQLSQELLRQLRLSLASPVLNQPGFDADAGSAIEGRQQLHPGSSPDGIEASEEPRQPLRIHAQWSGQDVQLWLGVDGQRTLSSSELAQIVRESQSWLNAQGARLLSVTCNGQLIYATPDAMRSEPVQATATAFKQSQPGKSSTSGFFSIYSYFDSQEA